MAVIALFINILVPDTIFEYPAYSSENIGIKEIMNYIKTIYKVDFCITILSGISSIITYIGKERSYKTKKPY